MSIAELSIPQGWEAIGAEWMTAALSGHFPGATVSQVAVVLRDDGTNRRARLQLTYSARGADPRDSTRPMTIDQVANGVRGLARMHSEYWGDRLTNHRALAGLSPLLPSPGSSTRRCTSPTNDWATRCLPRYRL